MSDWMGLPEPSPAVLQGLKGIHPGLYVQRCQYLLDQASGMPKRDMRTGELTLRPRYWVWIDHRGRKSPLFPVETREGEYMPCDMRLVRRLGTDLGIICESADELDRALSEQDEKRESARQNSERERFRRFIENNGGIWRRALENAKNGVLDSHKSAKMRDPVLYSYNGQPLRSSSHGTVPMSAKERGFDTPEN
jgi:hypothetical protein